MATTYVNEISIAYYYEVGNNSAKRRSFTKTRAACAKARALGLTPDTFHHPEEGICVVHCTGTKPKLLELAKKILNSYEGEVEVTINKRLRGEKE